MGVIKAICISGEKGVAKTEIQQAVLKKDWGIETDAHAGNWHRQVSLLSYEKIKQFKAKGADVEKGSFGENLIVEGYDLRVIPVGSIFKIGEARLELTQIGKECHTHCQIYKRMGDCIMPREGVFAAVTQGGAIQVGDEVELLSPSPDRAVTAAVITLSDKGAQGQREDKSGPIIVERLQALGYRIVETLLLPDHEEILKNHLTRLADQRQINLIVTTGGTGFSPRDITPEATLAVATRNAPGIAEAMRACSMLKTKRAMLSRAASVIRNQTLIVNLPGSPKAVNEVLDYIGAELEHGVRILTGRDSECARP